MCAGVYATVAVTVALVGNAVVAVLRRCARLGRTGDTEVVKPFFSLFFGSLLEDCSSRRLSRRLHRDGDVVTLVLPRDLEGVISAESFGLCPPSFGCGCGCGSGPVLTYRCLLGSYRQYQ